MSSRILAKLACWGQEQMPKADLHFYLQWLKDQLTVNVSYMIKVGLVSIVQRLYSIILIIPHA